jgi:hypothetical protein
LLKVVYLLRGKSSRESDFTADGSRIMNKGAEFGRGRERGCGG